MKQTIEYRNISELRPAARNARRHSKQQVDELVASIKEFGFTAPILIGNNGEIIAVMAGSKRLSSPA